MVSSRSQRLTAWRLTFSRPPGYPGSCRHADAGPVISLRMSWVRSLLFGWFHAIKQAGCSPATGHGSSAISGCPHRITHPPLCRKSPAGSEHSGTSTAPGAFSAPGISHSSLARIPAGRVPPLASPYGKAHSDLNFFPPPGTTTGRSTISSPPPHGVLHGVLRTAGRAVKNRDQQRGMVHHIPVPPLHAAGGISGRDQRLKVAGGHQPFIPLPLIGGPGIRLCGTGNGSLHGHVRMCLPQGQHALAEIQIASHGHTTEKWR